jgi:hypothetical protein
MKNFTYLIIFTLMFFLSGCSTDVITSKGEDFFTHHSIWQLLGWVFFPRIMFWFFSVITGGFWFWVGVFFVPRIMVAFWATTYYWNTNPIICVIAWVVALSGEGTEKSTVTRF